MGIVIDNTPGFAAALSGYRNQDDEIKKRQTDLEEQEQRMKLREREADQQKEQFGWMQEAHSHGLTRRPVLESQQDTAYNLDQEHSISQEGRANAQEGRASDAFNRTKAGEDAINRYAELEPIPDSIPEGERGQYRARLEAIKGASGDDKMKLLQDYRGQLHRAAIGAKASELNKRLERFIQSGAIFGGTTSAQEGGRKSGEDMSKEERDYTQKLSQLQSMMGQVKEAPDPETAAQLLKQAETAFTNVQDSAAEFHTFISHTNDASQRIDALKGQYSKNQAVSTRLRQLKSDLDFQRQPPDKIDQELDAIETGAAESLYGNGRSEGEMPPQARAMLRQTVRKTSDAVAVQDITHRNAARNEMAKKYGEQYVPLSGEEQDAIYEDHFQRSLRESLDDYGWTPNSREQQGPFGNDPGAAPGGGQTTPTQKDMSDAEVVAASEVFRMIHGRDPKDDDEFNAFIAQAQPAKAKYEEAQGGQAAAQAPQQSAAPQQVSTDSPRSSLIRGKPLDDEESGEPVGQSEKSEGEADGPPNYIDKQYGSKEYKDAYDANQKWWADKKRADAAKAEKQKADARSALETESRNAKASETMRLIGVERKLPSEDVSSLRALYRAWKKQGDGPDSIEFKNLAYRLAKKYRVDRADLEALAALTPE
jgi:hypothetical protein